MPPSPSLAARDRELDDDICGGGGGKRGQHNTARGATRDRSGMLAVDRWGGVGMLV